MCAVLCYGFWENQPISIATPAPLTIEQFPGFSQIPIFYHLRVYVSTGRPAHDTSFPLHFLTVNLHPSSSSPRNQENHACPSQPPAHSERRSSTPSTQASPLRRTAPLPFLRFLTSSSIVVVVGTEQQRGYGPAYEYPRSQGSGREHPRRRSPLNTADPHPIRTGRAPRPGCC